MDWYGIPRACVNIKNLRRCIGDTPAPEIKYWHPDQPVFISAQTGAGKSHFIIHTLLPHVLCACPNFSESAPESILVLSNRLANNKQFKLDLNKQVKQEAPNANWSKIQRIGNVYIYTYQNIFEPAQEYPSLGDSVYRFRRSAFLHSRCFLQSGYSCYSASSFISFPFCRAYLYECDFSELCIAHL